MRLSHSVLTKCLSSALVSSLFLLSGCTAVKIVDAAASTAVGTAVGAVKVAGKVVGAAIPDKDEDE
jgi:hypothetical protein